MYKTVLKNEVNIVDFLDANYNNHKNFNKNLYVLGYGSLLHSVGWNGRGMTMRVHKDDLQECWVSDFKRGKYGLYGEFTFYGTVHHKHSYLNGVLYNINNIDDWLALMMTEAIAGIYDQYNYRVVDVTDNVTGVKLPEGSVVHMVVNEISNLNSYKYLQQYPRYYKDVWKGVKKERSNQFIDEFLTTGGVKS